MPLYWDDKTGIAVDGDRQVRYRDALVHRPDGGAGVQRHRARSRAVGPGTRRQVPADRAARDDGAAQLHLARQQPEPRRAARGRGRVRQVDPLGLHVGAETDGRVLVDATDFFLRDVVNAGPRLGNYRVDRTRSAINVPRTKGFPKNTEIDTMLTFTNEGGGAAGGGRGGGGRGGGGFGGGMFSGTVGSVTPTADSVTLREHHTFAELPDANYKPRARRPALGFRRAPVRRLRRADHRRRSSSASSGGIGSRRSTRRRASARRRNRSTTTSTAARPSRPAPRSSKGRAGGTRRSRPPAIATPSKSSCCPRAPTRWTSATT